MELYARINKGFGTTVCLTAGPPRHNSDPIIDSARINRTACRAGEGCGLGAAWGQHGPNARCQSSTPECARTGCCSLNYSTYTGQGNTADHRQACHAPSASRSGCSVWACGVSPQVADATAFVLLILENKGGCLLTQGTSSGEEAPKCFMIRACMPLSFFSGFCHEVATKLRSSVAYIAQTMHSAW